MRTLVSRIVAVGLAVLPMPLLFAQPPGGPPPFGGPPPPLMLLGQKVVQQELKLTREQLRKIDELRAKEMQAFRPRPGAVPADMGDKMKELVKESRKAVSDILKQDQAQRFKEITLQAHGEAALGEPDVATDLGLSEEQQKKVKAVCETATKDRAALFQGKPANPKEMQMSMEQITKKAAAKILDELTSEQRSKWDEMKGKPLKGLVLTPPLPGPPPR